MTVWLAGMRITADRLNDYSLDDETTSGFVIGAVRSRRRLRRDAVVASALRPTDPYPVGRVSRPRRSRV